MKTKILELVYHLGALSIRPKILVANGTVFSGYFARQPNEVYPKFRNLLPENFRSIRLSTRNFWLNGKCPRLRGFYDSNFRNLTVFGISGNFSRKFPYHLTLFRNFRIFRRMESALDYPFILKNRQFERLSGLH